MRVSSFCLFLTIPVLLAGCQSNTVKVAKLPPSGNAAPEQQLSLTSPEEQSILSLGRGMSDGSVDIYEPGVAKLDVPTIETFNPRPSPVPESNNVIVRDPSVTVFSLEANPTATDGATVLTPMPSAVAPVPVYAPPAEPVHRYASELTPTNDRGAAVSR